MCKHCERGSERARVCVCVSVCVAAAAAWPFGNFIDTDTTQSVGNCCIQRFVRSPTELISRIRLDSHSHFGSHTKLVHFVRSSFASFIVRSFVFVSPTLRVCVRVTSAGYRAAAASPASSSSSASFNVIVINSITSFRFGLSFSLRACACVFVACILHRCLASRTCVLVVAVAPPYPHSGRLFTNKVSARN